MWNLTKEHCRTIPHRKSSSVICTITDYLRDPDNDKAMLEILLSNYDKVFLWLQGSSDMDYLKELGYQDRVSLVPSSLEAYDQILQLADLDYVGTRLHAGIRALAFSHRTIIVSIDNRAECISKDTGLPVVMREKITSQLSRKIQSEFETVISLPEEDIKKWKSQFK